MADAGLLHCSAAGKILNPALRGRRDALCYIRNGETFGGRKTAEMGLINEAVPRGGAQGAVTAIARSSLKRIP